MGRVAAVAFFAMVAAAVLAFGALRTAVAGDCAASTKGGPWIMQLSCPGDD